MDWHYPHETLYFYMLAATAFMVAVGVKGGAFVAALIVFSPFWFLFVALPWLIWKNWYLATRQQEPPDDY